MTGRIADSDSLFCLKPTAEIRTAESMTRAQIQSKNEELRQLVGPCYRDLIDSVVILKRSADSVVIKKGSADSVDSVVIMKRSAGSIVIIVSSVQHSINYLSSAAGSDPKSDDPGRRPFPLLRIADAESLFRSKPTAEMLTVESTTRAQIQSKNEERRQLVGYLDLIDSAGSIVIMKRSAGSIVIIVSSVPDSDPTSDDPARRPVPLQLLLLGSGHPLLLPSKLAIFSPPSTLNSPSVPLPYPAQMPETPSDGPLPPFWEVLLPVHRRTPDDTLHWIGDIHVSRCPNAAYIHDRVLAFLHLHTSRGGIPGYATPLAFWVVCFYDPGREDGRLRMLDLAMPFHLFRSMLHGIHAFDVDPAPYLLMDGEPDHEDEGGGDGDDIDDELLDDYFEEEFEEDWDW